MATSAVRKQQKKQTVVQQQKKEAPVVLPIVDNEKKIFIVDNTPGSPLYESRRKEYDYEKTEIRRLKRSIGTAFFDLGLRLKIVKEKELWKVEKKFRTFDGFLDHEGIRRRTAYNLISVVTSIPREKAEAWGVSLSYVVASCATDESVMKAISEFASNGCSVRDAIREVTNLKSINGGISKLSTPDDSPLKEDPPLVALPGEDPNNDSEDTSKTKNSSKRTVTRPQPLVKKKTLDLVAITEKEKIEIGWLYKANVELNNINLFIEFNPSKKKATIEIISK